MKMRMTAGAVAALWSMGAAFAAERTIPAEDFRDRMIGAWLGQSVGVAYGWPTEFTHNGTIIPAKEMPVWKPEVVNNTFEQDDLYVEMTFIDTLLRRGLGVTTREAGVDFANSAYRLWCANLNARNNLRNGIAAPASSHPKFHATTDDIDYQIEADFSGILAPGLPQAAVDLGETFGRIMNYGDGLYAGQFVGALYAEAYFETDRVRLVEKALKAIPSESKYAGMVRDMLAWHAANPTCWQAAWTNAVEKYYRTKANVGRVSMAQINVKVNGAMVLLGLLYGDGDMDRTMYVSTAGGFDSDCNPSTACGVLGTMIGSSRFAEKYSAKLDRTKKWSFTRFTWGGLITASDRLAREIVVKYGGRIEKDAEGRERFVLPVAEVRPSAFFDSSRPGPVPPDERMSMAERAEVGFRPCAEGKPSIARLSVTCTRDSHLYRQDETAEFDVTSDVTGLPVRVSVQRGYLPIRTFDTTTPVRVSHRLGEPGFVICKVQALGPKGPTGKPARAGAGFDPSLIRTVLPPPKDYDAFWESAFAEQAAIEPDFTSRPLGDGLELVSCRTVQGTRMYGFLYLPKGKGPFPLQVSVGGGDSICCIDGELAQARSKEFADRAFLNIHLPPWEPSARTSKEAFARHAAWTKENGTTSLFRWKGDKSPRERWFYRCILGSCRLIDHAVSRPGVDRSRVYYVGGSTGGGYGVFLAAFSPHLRAAVCEVPNYGNAGGPSAGRPSGEDDRGEHWQTSLYYDAAHCAPRIKCPVFMSCGFIDETCTAETIYCIYNELRCRKVMYDKTENGHGDCPRGYWSVRKAWLESTFGM